MIKTEIRPAVGFEEDYAKYVARKAMVEEEVRAEFERVLAERTAKLDQLISLTSEVVEFEVPDEEILEEPTEEIVGE